MLTEDESNQELSWLDEWGVVAASGETVSKRNRWLRTAFGALPLEEDETPAAIGTDGDTTPTPLEATLRLLTRGAKQVDGSVLLDSIDWPTYLETIRASKFFHETSDKDALEAWAQAGVLYPWSWDQFQVIYSDSIGEKRHRALAVLFDSVGRFHEVRWWLIEREGRWLIYDWEVIDFGVRESTEAALEWSLQGNPALRAYEDLLFASRANPAIFERDLPVPGPLVDSLYVQLAYDYLDVEKWDVALRMANRVQHPEIAIGATVAKARAHLFLDQMKQANEQTDRLAHDIGPSIHVRELRSALNDQPTPPP